MIKVCDIFGKEVKIGDHVCWLNKRNGETRTGKIIKITQSYSTRYPQFNKPLLLTDTVIRITVQRSQFYGKQTLTAKFCSEGVYKSWSWTVIDKEHNV